jgi:hypothetical protein
MPAAFPSRSFQSHAPPRYPARAFLHYISMPLSKQNALGAGPSRAFGSRSPSPLSHQARTAEDKQCLWVSILFRDPASGHSLSTRPSCTHRAHLPPLYHRPIAAACGRLFASRLRSPRENGQYPQVKGYVSQCFCHHRVFPCLPSPCS